jgi:hypothetical protein
MHLNIFWSIFSPLTHMSNSYVFECFGVKFTINFIKLSFSFLKNKLKNQGPNLTQKNNQMTSIKGVKVSFDPLSFDFVIVHPSYYRLLHFSPKLFFLSNLSSCNVIRL